MILLSAWPASLTKAAESCCLELYLWNRTLVLLQFIVTANTINKLRLTDLLNKTNSITKSAINIDSTINFSVNFT